MDAEQADASDLKGRMKALHWNRRLWTTLATDCASPDNRLPVDLRANIISLSIWVDKHTSQVMQKHAAIQPLIDVNRIIMQGLSNQMVGGGQGGEGAPPGAVGLKASGLGRQGSPAMWIADVAGNAAIGHRQTRFSSVSLRVHLAACLVGVLEPPGLPWLTEHRSAHDERRCQNVIDARGRVLRQCCAFRVTSTAYRVNFLGSRLNGEPWLSASFTSV